MLELYHFPGAICAQKVRVALAEKNVAWQSRSALAELRAPDYLKLNPNGYVPTLVHDGRAITESRIINEYINDVFPTPPLLPADPFDRARVALWTKQIDDSLHLNVYVLTFVTSFRERYLAMSPEQLEKALPLNNPVKRHYTLELIEHGWKSPLFAMAVTRFHTLILEMERALSQSSWLVGETYSLADVDYTPYLRRLEDLGLWALTRESSTNVARWFSAVQARPSYQTAILGWVTAEDRERERRNVGVVAPLLAAALKAA